MSEIVPICKNSSFRRTYTKGKFLVSPILVTYVLKNHVHCIRVGIATGKKTRNATKRNHSRRIIHGAARQLVPELSGGYDLIFVVRAKTPFVKSTDILCNMRKRLSQSGVLGWNALLLQRYRGTRNGFPQ